MYVKLKKKYGQNFLIDENIANKIVDLINFKKLKILEIGPGDGKLTNKIISKNPKKLELIEIDKDLTIILREKFKKNKFIKVINKNVLKHEINDNYDLVISNLPYNISSQVLVKLSIMDNAPKEMILMFFKFNLKFHVSKNCYRPIPKNDSSVLKFEKLNKCLLKKNEIDNFIKFKRYLFSYKRKSLKNLLKKYKINSNINLDIRAESLELKMLIKIFREINL